MARDLSTTTRRALPFIESGLARGMSGNAIARELSAAGIGIRRTELQEAVRRIRGAELAADRLKFVRPDLRVDPNRLAESVTGKQLRDFSYRVRITGQSALTGQTETKYVQVSTNELLTREEIESVGASYVIQDEADLPSASAMFDLETVELVTATRR